MSALVDEKKIGIGVSSCLLGNNVRYDGGHKRDWFIDGTLRRYFEFLPICPEMEIGMGVPRQPIQLVNYSKGTIRAVGVWDKNIDVTDKLESFSQRKIQSLGEIRGYIFKSKSPSCGMGGVNVSTRPGMPTKKSPGIFARALINEYPKLPVEDEDRLADPGRRENFIERVFVYDRWLKMFDSGLTAKKLVEFHTSHELLLMSHSQVASRRLGRIVANAGSGNLQALAEIYGSDLMDSLRRPTTKKSHFNVLQHLLGYLKKFLAYDEKKEMIDIMETYKKEQLPLIIPITLLKYHLKRHPTPYVGRQYYLDPHPKELLLRNSL